MRVFGGVLVLALSLPAAAQQGPGARSDAEARALFQAGLAAFDDARYEEALERFERAYEVSGRVELLFNIGTTADRLRRDAKALEAFEAFLESAPADHPRRRNVEVRVAAIRAAANRAEGASEPESPAPPSAPLAPRTVELPLDAPRIVASSTLAGLGLGGVLIAAIGIARGRGCVDHRERPDPSSACIEARRPRWRTIGPMGGLGVVLLAGGVTWLVLTLLKRSSPSSANGLTAAFHF